MNDRPYLDPSALEPALTRGLYKPEVGGRITVQLPGEVLLCVVEKVVGRSACLAKVDRQPHSRSHTVRKGQVIPVARSLDPLLMVEVWRMVDDHELEAAHAAERFAREEQVKVDQEERERIAELQRLRAAEQEAIAYPPQPEPVPEPPVFRRPVLGSRRTKVRVP